MISATTSWEPIGKRPEDLRPPPNMRDYEGARAAFSWAKARAELDGLPGGGGLNIAYEAVDRHVRAGAGQRCAIRWLRRDGGRRGAGGRGTGARLRGPIDLDACVAYLAAGIEAPA